MFHITGLKALLVLFSFMLLAACSEQAAQATAETASDRLRTLFSEWNEEVLRLNPITATSRGDHRYDHLWGMDGLSDEYADEDRRLNTEYLRRLNAIDRTRLNEDEQVSYDVFRYQRERTSEGYREGYVDFSNKLPINQFSSMANYLVLLGSGGYAQPFKTERDYDNWISRSDGFVRHVDLLIQRMREGMAQGIVQPRILMEKLLPQLQAQLVGNVEDSPFWKPVNSLPEEFDEQTRKDLRAIYAEHIGEVLIPAYRRLAEFIRNEYLPACRDSVGLSALPGGKAYYKFLVGGITTTDLSPGEIHELGKREVARIYSQMDEMRQQIGFAGDIGEFFNYLREDSEFYPTDASQLLDGYEQLRERINNALPTLFSEFPKTDYEIREVEAFRAPSMAAAQYFPGSPDGSRPGIFYVNTHALDSRPLYLMEALILHEASPGHHFQISLAQENGDLPEFRKHAGFTAYVEGWALYAETLGPELGLYQDPMQKIGSLYTEIWRANRLVVDTGLHSMGWNRQQAIDWMRKYSPIPDQDVIAEVDRYIAIPGQALSYKIGQLKISELRARAEQELGDRFDIRDFHTQVLIHGALPIKLLEQIVQHWIDTQKVAA